jgi:hypothetical protein
MQSSLNHHSINAAESVLFPDSSLVEANVANPDESSQVDSDPIQFHGCYAGCMDMNADRETVARYLDVHQAWFHRCAHPMKAEPISENGYALIIGRFGSFGYEVEPKVGLDLLPQDEGVYRIQTIPVPDYEPPGYDVDFQAALQLQESKSSNGAVVTQVEWELDLQVYIHFPRFIRALPLSLIHSTGDRLLNQIVRQASRRLTHKVQEDFHQTHDLPMPKTGNKKVSWNRPSVLKG